MNAPTRLAGPARSTTADRPAGRAGRRSLGPVARAVVGGAVGVGLIGLLWAWFARRQPALILPSPAQTWDALVDLQRDGKLVRELRRTFGRAAAGVGIATVVGAVWGTLNGRSAWASAISRPALSVLMALPPVVVVSVGLVWFGPGPTVTRLVIAIMALPLLVVAVQEAIGALDRDLLEMASVFQLSRWRVLRHVIVPGIASPVVAVLSVAIGQALRVAVMAELLASADGIGAEVALARTNLETADLFAWALVMIVAVIVVEALLLRPLTNRLTRWRAVPLVP